MFVLSFKCRLAHHFLYTHIKKKQPHSTLSESKLLFFSVLIAICQRNDHFCGCKGTHYYSNNTHKPPTNR